MRRRPISLARARREAGLSLRDLASKAGVALATLSRVETGLVRPHNRTAKKIADALGLGVSDVIELNGHDDTDREEAPSTP